MQISNSRNKYIVSLADTSEHVVQSRMCMDGFACHQLLLADKPGYAIAQEICEKEFAAGDIIYASAGKFFGIRCKGEIHIRHIAFIGKRLRPLLHYCGFGEFRVISLPEDNNTHNIFNDIFRYSFTHQNESELSASIYSLLANLGAVTIEEDSYIYDKQSLLIRPIIDCMQKNYRQPDIPFDILHPFPGISADELNKLFLDTFSVNIQDYYKRLRMENAKHLLFFYRKSDYVAVNMGYSDVRDFNYDFYNAFKISPEEFIALYHRA